MKQIISDIFKIESNNIRPSRGKVLISEPFLCEEPFRRSVIMMIDHNHEGSMGIIINKPLPLLLNDIIKEFKYLNDIPVYCGGPMGQDMLFYIHSISGIPQSIPIGDNLFFNGDFTEIKRYILQGNPIEGKIRFFLGYSGWSEGQLRQEIKENTWLISQGTQQLLFDSPCKNTWKHALGNMGNKYETWARFPQIPSWN